MASHSIDDLLALINQQVKYQEDLHDCMVKVSAMIEVAQGDGFLDHKPATIYHYFWALNDVVGQASSMQEQCLDTLCKVLPVEDL